MLPDLIGYKLNEALDILEARGMKKVSVQVTAPPREENTEPTPESRVLRMIEKKENTIEILVCN